MDNDDERILLRMNRQYSRDETIKFLFSIIKKLEREVDDCYAKSKDDLKLYYYYLNKILHDLHDIKPPDVTAARSLKNEYMEVLRTKLEQVVKTTVKAASEIRDRKDAIKKQN